MDYTQAFAISAAGMTVERTRVDVATVNLANANTVQGADGSAFRPLRAVARVANSVAASFPDLVDASGGSGQVSLPALPTVSVEAADVARDWYTNLAILLPTPRDSCRIPVSIRRWKWSR